jgi:outer membrane protein assembly factor BamB
LAALGASAKCGLPAVALAEAGPRLASFTQDWTGWRGPARTGIAAKFTPPASWPDRPKQVWKVDAGLGHSSPVVSGERVFLFSRVFEREALTAIDLRTGKRIWRQMYDAPYDMNPAATGHGKGPKSTPIVDGTRIFTFGISGILSAWNVSNGTLLWRRDFQKEFSSTSPDFGVAMSPLVANGLLIVHAGGKSNGAVFALDPAKGTTKWTWEGDGPAYASPVLATIAATAQVITQTEKHVVSLALANGRPLWQIPFTTSYDQNVVTAVVSGDVVIYSGLSKPLTAVKVSEDGGRWTTAPLWQNDSVPMYMSSPVISGGFIYGLSHRNRGQFFCVDLQTGATRWTTRGREGENAALIEAGGYLLATTTEGELVVAKADSAAFTVVRRYTVAESPIWTHPVPAGGGILIKDTETLVYWTF